MLHYTLTCRLVHAYLNPDSDRVASPYQTLSNPLEKK